jgi:hypothetical protein
MESDPISIYKYSEKALYQLVPFFCQPKPDIAAKLLAIMLFHIWVFQN